MTLMARALFAAALLLSEGQAFKVPPPRGGTVAVIGPTGKLGRRAVEQLLQEGYTARCLLRHSTSTEAEASCAPDASSAEVAAWLAATPDVELVRGDVTDRGSLDELLEGCTACIACNGARRTTKLSDLLPWVDETTEPTHSKQVNYVGTRNLIEAARASAECKRVVRITGKGEAPWSFFSILLNGLGSMAKGAPPPPLGARAGAKPRLTPHPSSRAMARQRGTTRASSCCAPRTSTTRSSGRA